MFSHEPNTTSTTPGRAARSAAFGGLGLLSISVQALVLRELLVAWRGNEMSFGIALAMWLALTGLGSALGSRRARRDAPGFARRLAALGVLAPISVMTARLSPALFGVSPGETTGPLPLVAAAALSITPFAVTAGSLFPAAVALAGGREPARGAGRVYVLEAAGAVVAGLVVSLVLLPSWSPLRIAAAAAAAGAAGGAFLARGGTRVRVCTLAVVLAVAAALPATDRFDAAVMAFEWRSLGPVATGNSVHGRIVATRYGSQESLFENGVLVASAPDRLAAEEAVHMALLQHPAPRRVLLAGGGLGGAIPEILRHPTVTTLDYVELDPELVAVAREELGSAMTAGLDDPRVTVHYGDARLFVKDPRGPYDCVIVNVPDPTTMQLNRLYTVGFFNEVDANLADGGVIGLSVQSAENYVSEDLAACLSTFRASLKEVFPQVVALPGDPCHLIAGRTELTRVVDTLSARIEGRKLGTAFIRGYYLSDRLRPERIAAFDASLESAPAELNTDLRPLGYARSLVLWNRQFSGVPELLRAGRAVATFPNVIVAALALALVGSLIPGRGRPRRPLRAAVVLSIALVGATEITLEIAALTAYQSLYGYVYGHVALITAAFMGGLAAGGAVGTAAARRPRPVTYVVLSAGIAAVPLGLASAVGHLASLPPDALVARTPVFLLIVVGAALLAGVQFPLAAALVSSERGGGGAGRLYAADLAGSAVAAPVAALILLPTMGLPDTMGVLSLLNGGMLVALLAGAVRWKRGTGSRRTEHGFSRLSRVDP